MSDIPSSSAAAAAVAPLVLPAQLTHDQGGAALAMLAQAARAHAQHGSGEGVLLDGSQLTRFDSTALAVILACRRSVLSHGQSFAVRGLPVHLMELAALYGVRDLIDGTAAPAPAV